MYRNERRRRGFARHIRRTLMNKLYAIAALAIGVGATYLADGDATALVLIGFLAVPMFFSKENWIV